eukprot:CAMPEP_0181024802 /NCGR_PEP_ID=MMETSP1070-20121207/2768_1 /TAXON_ID=265543 /ORGANISM="Minutocellus polymorphus, Strain NH13" /LENGTH=99 /DNA_ID=CAMNT_0023101887 /DNA_START=1164 /DNA_END=1466 /DNA_ORIENTATION=-
MQERHDGANGFNAGTISAKCDMKSRGHSPERCMYAHDMYNPPVVGKQPWNQLNSPPTPNVHWRSCSMYVGNGGRVAFGKLAMSISMSRSRLDLVWMFPT